MLTPLSPPHSLPSFFLPLCIHKITRIAYTPILLFFRVIFKRIVRRTSYCTLLLHSARQVALRSTLLLIDVRGEETELQIDNLSGC